jgi:hypothetical protein
MNTCSQLALTFAEHYYIHNGCANSPTGKIALTAKSHSTFIYTTGSNPPTKVNNILSLSLPENKNPPSFILDSAAIRQNYPEKFQECNRA